MTTHERRARQIGWGITAVVAAAITTGVPTASADMVNFHIAAEPTVRVRVRPPGPPRVLDDYSFTLGDLSDPRPVRASSFDDLDGENFRVSEVPGLSRIEDIVETARTRSEIPDGQVTAVLVSRFGRDIRMVANVVSARSEVVVEFDRAGVFLRAQ
ncbi:hypothetical protein ABZ412_22575 [Nocardia sp. NPDC005746]|uniref:hypothetical protein n=1 Tax=Nocardia sp. NPDC005746 TaxID=3157062 RepID=UPI00340DF085